MQRDEDKPATAVSIGEEVCRALGIDPKRTVSVELKLASGCMAEVCVTSFVTNTQGLAVCELLKQRFDLVERDHSRVQVKADGSAPEPSLP